MSGYAEVRWDERQSEMPAEFEINQNQVAETFTKLRESVRVSQKRMAAILGMKSPGTIWNYENRIRVIPWHLLEKCAKVAGYEVKIVFRRIDG